jgi:hypothetical protein
MWWFRGLFGKKRVMIINENVNRNYFYLNLQGGEDEIDCAFDSRRRKFGKNGTDTTLDGSQSGHTNGSEVTEVTTNIISTTELTTVKHESFETTSTIMETTSKPAETTSTPASTTTYPTTSHQLVTEMSTVKVDESGRPRNKTISRPQQSKIIKMFECSK